MQRQIITPEQIQKFSSCPKQYILSEHITVSDDAWDKIIIRDIVKQAYINRAQHGYTPQWDTIKSRLNAAAFRNIDVKDKETFDRMYKHSVRMLNILHWWYYKHFLNDTRDGIANVILDIPISNSTLSYTVDLVMIDPTYKIVPVFFNIGTESVHNSIAFKTVLWMLQKEMKTTITMAEFYEINNDFSIKVHQIFDKSSINDIERTVNFLVRGIEYKVYYPAVSSQCDSCSYRNMCNL